MSSLNDVLTLLLQKNAAGTDSAPNRTINLGRVCRTFTFDKTVNGVFSALVVNFEGSLDGSRWFQLGTDNTTGASTTFVVDKPTLWLRANVGTFTGGTDVTVKAVVGE